MPIAKEGYPFIAASVAVAFILNISLGWDWALPVWLVALFMIQFFREPKREIPTEAGAVVSPADGKVVAVSTSQNPYGDGDSTRIAIFLNVFSVHSNRIPVSGSVSGLKYVPGKFFNAAVDKSAEENERNELKIRTQRGDEVVCVQIAGLIARRILCYVKEGDEVKRGQKYGFIRFGSRVEIFLPSHYRVLSGIGDKVKGGSDVIAIES